MALKVPVKLHVCLLIAFLLRVDVYGSEASKSDYVDRRSPNGGVFSSSAHPVITSLVSVVDAPWCDDFSAY